MFVTIYGSSDVVLAMVIICLATGYTCAIQPYFAALKWAKEKRA